MANIKISVINQCSVLTDAQVKPVVDAMQVQVHRDFAPEWGIDADLVFVPKGQTPDASHWWLVLLDDSDTAGALGYHELTPTGLPIGKVFAKTDIDYNLSWSVTASHELLEMLSDPDINLTTFVQTSNTSGFLFAYENCDAVEDDSFGYEVNGVKMSDFVLPCYFQRSMPAKKWDFCGHLTGPVPQMLSGGYLSQFAVGMPGAAPGWTQINAQKLIGEQHVTDRTTRKVLGARRHRRAADRAEWKVSTVDKF
ncbi:MAG: hypothetical protein KGI25_07790 [Thaumarchaeota archaeon]|nr:hypothetical protein [Nitrososphaerota archaeon]